MNNFLKNKSDIIAWLDSYNIKNYKLIIDDKYGYVVDVSNDVYLYDKELSFVPIKCNNVSGSFYCNSNKISSLQFCPQIISGNFDCSDNNLTSLKGCPKTINGNFYCYNNKLFSLEFCPITISGYFHCSNNEITSLNHFPNHIGGIIYLGKNKIFKVVMDENMSYNFAELYLIHLEHKITAEQELLNNSINKNLETSFKKINLFKI